MRSFFILAFCLLVTATVSGQGVVNECLSNGAPVDSGLPPVVETINVTDSFTIADTRALVQITHTFQGDLDIDLMGPTGTSVRLHDQGGGGADNINITYTDGGVPNGDLPYDCGCAMQPAIGAMFDYFGTNTAGNWTLTVDDQLGGDVGTLDNWCIMLFEEAPDLPIVNLSCSSASGSGVVDATWTNIGTYDSVDVYIDGLLVDTLPGSSESYSSDPLPIGSSVTLAVEGVANGTPTGQVSCMVTLFPDGVIPGPDVVYSDCQGVTRWPPSIGGIHAYSLGSFTCNIGTENLAWGGVSPLLGMNAFRLDDDRLVQIGMSWMKNGTGAAAGNGCGLPCNGQGGSVLGAGCLDVYGSGFNGSQGILGPRSQVNAFTGDYPGASGSNSSNISKRMQVRQTDMQVAGALFFVEGVYVAFDDAQTGHAFNNASWKRVTINGSFDMNVVGDMAIGQSALHAWKANGLGLGMPDPSIEIVTAPIPGEGMFEVLSKATDLGGGMWRYDYAIFNLNSHRSAASFNIPGVATATNIGFHDVDYHSGEPFDNTDWNSTVDGDGVTWSSPETFAQNPNTNALRFGTTYNFWFDSDQPPAQIDATIGIFRPGTPDSITVPVTGPEGATGTPFIRGDADGNGTFDGLVDGIRILDFQFSGADAPPCLESADADGDGVFNGIIDGLVVLNHQFSSGPAPAAPYPSCGQDPDPMGSLGCDAHPGCP